MSGKKRPYRLPKALLCDPDEKITMELVEEYIWMHEERMPRYSYLENLYIGFHDVFNLPEKESWKPDNRLVVNFPKFMTDVFTGYAYGIPVKKTFDDDNFGKKVTEFDDLNNIIDHDYEMVKMVCKYGHAFEYFYQDETGKTRVKGYNPKNIFVVYEDSLKKSALFAVRYGRKRKTGERYGEVITPLWIRDFKGSVFVGEERENVYGKINIVEWVLNDERLGLYECVAGLTETINKGLGEKANDVDAFAEAYLAILGAEVDDDDIYRIRDNRIINLYGTDDARDILVQFLQKPVADGTQENLLDRSERFIHKIGMVPDINSESFGNSSGTALAYKLLSMDDLANTLDRKVTKSMSKRYKIFCTMKTNSQDPDAWKGIHYKTFRNIPKNMSEEAQTARNLESVVSKKTQFKVLSIVDNPEEEIEQMRKEKEEEMSGFSDINFGGGANV